MHVIDPVKTLAERYTDPSVTIGWADLVAMIGTAELTLTMEKEENLQTMLARYVIKMGTHIITEKQFEVASGK